MLTSKIRHIFQKSMSKYWFLYKNRQYLDILSKKIQKRSQLLFESRSVFGAMP